MQPDPLSVLASDPSNPQSLNLYSYVQNDPVNNIDPSGLLVVFCHSEFVEGKGNTDPGSWVTTCEVIWGGGPGGGGTGTGDVWVNGGDLGSVTIKATNTLKGCLKDANDLYKSDAKDIRGRYNLMEHILPQSQDMKKEIAEIGLTTAFIEYVRGNGSPSMSSIKDFVGRAVVSPHSVRAEAKGLGKAVGLGAAAWYGAQIAINMYYNWDKIKKQYNNYDEETRELNSSYKAAIDDCYKNYG